MSSLMASLSGNYIKRWFRTLHSIVSLLLCLGLRLLFSLSLLIYEITLFSNILRKNWQPCRNKNVDFRPKFYIREIGGKTFTEDGVRRLYGYSNECCSVWYRWGVVIHRGYYENRPKRFWAKMTWKFNLERNLTNGSLETTAVCDPVSPFDPTQQRATPSTEDISRLRGLQIREKKFKRTKFVRYYF